MCSLNIRGEASASGSEPGQGPGPGAGSVGLLRKEERAQGELARSPRWCWGVWGRGVGAGPDWGAGWGCAGCLEPRGGPGMGITRLHPLLLPPTHPRASLVLLGLSKLLSTSGLRPLLWNLFLRKLGQDTYQARPNRHWLYKNSVMFNFLSWVVAAGYHVPLWNFFNIEICYTYSVKETLESFFGGELLFMK